MLRTNSKQARANFRHHVIGCLVDDIEYGETVEERIKTLYGNFRKWYCPYEKRRNPNEQNAFIDYLRGLPSGIDHEYSFYGQREALKTLLEESDAEANRYSDDRVDQTYYYLFTRAFFELLKDGADYD